MEGVLAAVNNESLGVNKEVNIADCHGTLEEIPNNL